MKSSWSNFEKLVIVVAILCIPVVGALGFMKQSKPKEAYVSQLKTTDVSAKTDGVALKKKEFTLKAYGALDREASYYFDGSAADVKRIELDFSKVDSTKVGTYTVKAVYGKKIFSFKIKVKESDNPQIKAEKTSFRYLVGQYSTIDELKEIVNVKAQDKDGRDLTKEIMGWPQVFPSEMGEQIYRLSVSDMYGNSGYLDIVIDFERVKN